jgi:hypothetical protein
MAKGQVSMGVASLIGFILFIIIAAVLFHYDQWWPGLIVGFGFGLSLRNALMRRAFEAVADLVVFLPLFIFERYNIGHDILVSLPIIFLICGIYIMVREFYYGIKMVIQKKDKPKKGSGLDKDDK